MKRRSILTMFAAVGLAALTGSVIRVGAQEAPAPGTIKTGVGVNRARSRMIVTLV